jgi:glyoxylase-like metal-dependent hydrolase (beta-lactamase superfamily II)
MNVRGLARGVVTVVAGLGLAGVLAPASFAKPPMVVAGTTVRIAEQVYVIPDQRVPLVPNVGIIVGTEGVLVVDTGMGPANAEIVLAEVQKITDLPIRYLVSTHFHPEHNFGAQSFPEETVLIYAIAQYEDLQNKGAYYRDWFTDMFGDDVRELLAPVKFVAPDVTFERKAAVDLGDLPVQLYHFGAAAHTGGDTVIYLPQQKILFSGGLTPNRFFPILPDADSSVAGWIKSLDELAKLDARMIVPGHGEVGETVLIERIKSYLTDMQTAALELRNEDVALSDAQEALFERFSAGYPDWEDAGWIRNAVEIVYAEAGPGS